jgi:hypothetical protein
MRPARCYARDEVLTKLVAGVLIIAFVARLLMRTRIRGLGKRSRSLMDIALVVLATAYIVQTLMFTLQ